MLSSAFSLLARLYAILVRTLASPMRPQHVLSVDLTPQSSQFKCSLWLYCSCPLNVAISQCSIYGLWQSLKCAVSQMCSIRVWVYERTVYTCDSGTVARSNVMQSARDYHAVFNMLF